MRYDAYMFGGKYPVVALGSCDCWLKGPIGKPILKPYISGNGPGCISDGCGEACGGPYDRAGGGKYPCWS